MASSGNTWFKKLRAKKRKFEMRHTKKRFAVDGFKAVEDLSSMVYRLVEENSLSAVKVVREYPSMPSGYVAPRKRRGGNGSRLSHAKRLLILDKALMRAEFFASLGVSV